jgi:hypothetical protein
LKAEIAADAEAIAKAMDDFDAGYHQDFLRVKKVARSYLARPVTATAGPLAGELRAALKKWGAGGRKAPQLKTRDEMAAALSAAQLYQPLQRLASTPLSSLTTAGGRRAINGAPTLQQAVDDFDACLIGTLQDLGESLFADNTNVTYPMKAVLLITGLMPAFDSQVRAGLQRGGFTGLNRTQFLIPPDARSADARKITHLPFILGSCWRAHQDCIRTGLLKSRYGDQLVDEPGRVFDVLLFMQGEAERALIIRFVGAADD